MLIASQTVLHIIPSHEIFFNVKKKNAISSHHALKTRCKIWIMNLPVTSDLGNIKKKQNRRLWLMRAISSRMWDSVILPFASLKNLTHLFGILISLFLTTLAKKRTKVTWYKSSRKNHAISHYNLIYFLSSWMGDMNCHSYFCLPDICVECNMRFSKFIS